MEEPMFRETDSEEEQELRNVDEALPSFASESEVTTSGSVPAAAIPEPEQKAEPEEKPAAAAEPEEVLDSKRELKSEPVSEQEPALEPEAAPESAPASEAALETREALRQLDERLAALDRSFQTKIMRSEKEAQIMDQMHAELQQYKSNLYAQLVKPIIKEVVTLREHILKLSADYAAKPAEEQHIPLKTFASFGFDLAQILEDNDVEIVNAEIGAPFDPVRQKVVEKIETGNKALDKTVAKTVGSGYVFMEQTLSAQKVSVYTYLAEKESEGESYAEPVASDDSSVLPTSVTNLENTIEGEDKSNG